MYRGRQWHPAPVLLPGTSHGWRSLEGCSPWGCWESDMTERLHFHFSLSCIGEGNGNTLQGSCLENPRDGGAWWAAVYGVAQSRTRLKRLSSSSSSIHFWVNPWQRACGHHSQFTQIIWSAADTRELATVSTRATPKAQANELFCKASLILFLSSFFS